MAGNGAPQFTVAFLGEALKVYAAVTSSSEAPSPHRRRPASSLLDPAGVPRENGRGQGEKRGLFAMKNGSVEIFLRLSSVVGGDIFPPRQLSPSLPSHPSNAQATETTLIFLSSTSAFFIQI
jgi:hypothetical protein